MRARTTYYFTIATVDIEGQSAKSNTMAVTTNNSPPDVAITGLVFTHDSVTVTVINQGLNTINTTLTVSYVITQDPIIGSQFLTLSSGASTEITFNWTSPIIRGRWQVTAYASPVLGETDTADNILAVIY